MANIVLSNHLAALANAAKKYTLAKLAELTLQGGASYSLPTASETLKGGVKVGTGLSMDGDTLNCTITGGASYSIATNTQAGLMSALDKQHLDTLFQDSTDFIDTVLAGVGGIFFPSASTAQDVITYSENFDFLDNKYLKIMNPPDWNAFSPDNKDTFLGTEYCLYYEENNTPFFGTSDFDTAYRVNIA